MSTKISWECPPKHLTSDGIVQAGLTGYGGFGFDFAIGGAVPEPSTWAMMLFGFAGLGFAGYRSTRRQAAVAFRA